MWAIRVAGYMDFMYCKTEFYALLHCTALAWSPHTSVLSFLLTDCKLYDCCHFDVIHFVCISSPLCRVLFSSMAAGSQPTHMYSTQYTHYTYTIFSMYCTHTWVEGAYVKFQYLFPWLHPLAPPRPPPPPGRRLWRNGWKEDCKVPLDFSTYEAHSFTGSLYGLGYRFYCTSSVTASTGLH